MHMDLHPHLMAKLLRYFYCSVHESESIYEEERQESEVEQTYNDGGAELGRQQDVSPLSCPDVDHVDREACVLEVRLFVHVCSTSKGPVMTLALGWRNRILIHVKDTAIVLAEVWECMSGQLSLQPIVQSI